MMTMVKYYPQNPLTQSPFCPILFLTQDRLHQFMSKQSSDESSPNTSTFTATMMSTTSSPTVHNNPDDPDYHSEDPLCPHQCFGSTTNLEQWFPDSTSATPSHRTQFY
jgi:hypothetical protein